MAFSFFMRDQHVLELAAEHLVQFAVGRTRIRVWDAGCAMGQETWSLAMILAERMNRHGFMNLRIDATDHDSENRFGDIVTDAVYPARDLARTPVALVGRYFEPVEGSGGERLKVCGQLRQLVTFHYHDLLSGKPVGGNYCLILCKNVLLHLQYEQRVDVFRMFHEALTPDGYLATEQTQMLPPEVGHLFERVAPDARIYRRLDPALQEKSSHCPNSTLNEPEGGT